MSLQIHYDSETDVLYIARPGEEEESVEVHPGVTLEFNNDKEIIGIEVLNASKIFKEVLEPLREKAGVG